MAQSISITIQYANGEKFDACSSDIIRLLLDALRENVELEYANKELRVKDIHSIESSVIILLSAIDNFESCL